MFQKSDSDDSDIEIISASEFQSNGRSPSTRPTALRHVGQSSTNSALYPATYGTKAAPGWMSGTLPRPNSNPGAPSMGSRVHNLPYSTSTGILKNSSLHSSNYGNSYQAIGNRPYGSGASISVPGSIGTGYHGSPGYSGYSMNKPEPGIGYGLNNMNGKFSGNTHQFYLCLKSDNETDNDFMQLPFPTTNFNDEMFGQFPSPFNDRMAGQLDYIMNDPRKTNEEIKALIENIRPDEDLPAEDREGTPDGLKYPLVRFYDV